MSISKVISNREEETMLTKLEKLKSSHPDNYDNSNSAIPINYKNETLKIILQYLVIILKILVVFY